MGDVSADHLFELAMSRHEAGELAEAESLYRRILESNPNDADTLQLLGILNYQLGRHEQALEALGRAASLQPEAADCQYHLAVALIALKRSEQAIASLRTATGLNREFPEALQLLAKTLHEQGNLDEAIPLYRRAIGLRPDSTDALVNLGNALQTKGVWAEAAEVCRRVTERRPEDALAWFALGNALHMRRAFGEAIAAYEKALELRADYVEVMANLADALAGMGRLDAALAACQKALAIQPDYYLAMNNLGIILVALDRVPEAIEAYGKALAGHPEFADGFFNLGNALRIVGRLEEAAGAFQKATVIKPDMYTAFNNLGTVLKEMRRLPDALWNFHQSIHLRPDQPSPHSNYIYALHYPHGIDAQTIFEEHVVWNARHARGLGREIRGHGNDQSPDRRLRVGYVSADFRQHSVGFFLEKLLTHHDPGQVEIFCYSDVEHADEMTGRFRATAHQWRDVGMLDRESLVEQIRGDGIDILVDLSGHAAGNRLTVFACKPAPVQITYLGYPDTTGLSAMDYRITDGLADPVGETERFHTEKLLRLPRTFICYSPDLGGPEVSALPALTAGRVTFGSFNALAKITPPMIAVWAEILRGTPGSRMIIKSHSGLTESSCRRRLLEIFESCGIGMDRIELRGKTALLGSHLEVYHEVDLALDTFPYHGTTTTCEAMWMGVPVVSLAGRTHASRVGVSLLTNAGLAEFIAQSTEEYVRIACEKARDLARLAKLRGALRGMMRESVLLDGKQFARDVEAAYRRVWREWVKSTR